MPGSGPGSGGGSPPAASSPHYHSPAPPPPPAAAAVLPASHFQRLADADHCIPPISSPTQMTAPLARNRSGSRTYQEEVLLQQQQRQAAQLTHEGSQGNDELERQRSRERAVEALEGRTPQAVAAGDDEMMSMNELRVEMETLLSLRRRSMNQPLTVDPDLPPTSPPTSAPPTLSSPNPASTSSAAAFLPAAAAARSSSEYAALPSTSTTTTTSPTFPSSGTAFSDSAPGVPTTSTAAAAPASRPRPQLTLQLAPPVLESPTGGPISPTAPSPAETGTLVRRRSTAQHPPKLPSEHPLPALPSSGGLTSPGGLHFPSPFGLVTPVPSTSSSSSSSLSPPTLETPPTASGSGTTSSPTSPPSYLDIPLSSIGTSSSSPSGGGGGELFWLPASLHPELAPQEFKAFIREQTSPEALARRSSLRSSSSSSSATLETGNTGTGANVGRPGAGGSRVGRRASLLRGEYKPRQDDGVGESSPTATGSGTGTTSELKRTTSDGNRRGVGGGLRRGSVINFEELTIKDLQRLEELAAKAEAEGTTAGEEEEGERLGRVLRRSLSLNPHRVAAAAAELQHQQQQQVYDPPTSSSSPSPERLSSLAEETDEAPLIVPPPGQILRRNARTRIRKASDGSEVGARGGSRFGGPRRSRTSTGGGGESSEGGVDLRASITSTSSAHGGTTAEDDGGSIGDHSMEDSISYESDEVVVRGGLRAPPPSTESDPSTGYGSAIPQPSPTSSDNQHIEFTMAPAVVEEKTVVSDEPEDVRMDHSHVDAQPVVTSLPSSYNIPDSAPPPALPERPAISPASADYDWATHNLQVPQPPPPPPTPAPEPQYHVHPQHLSRQPFSDVPPVQAVPLPTYEREKPPPSSSSSAPPSPVPSSAASSSSSSLPLRADSPKPSGGKEKKSGWARLGLGRDDDKGKKKGRGAKDDSNHHHHQHSHSHSSSSPGKESSGGFLGGLFGRKNREEHERPPPRAPSPPPEPKIPPPPPTASGVLLPNGRYANFYRLPIHVERAVYRLSHIKLANPRRPLYEQVLISNLMFWYLGLIQKPTTPPPPAAPPVPIPGMRAQQQQQQQQAQTPPPVAPLAVPAPAPVPKESPKRAGLSKPGRGGRTAETPVRATSFEVQNQQLVEEQQHQRYQQQQQQQRQQQQQYAPLQASHNQMPNGRPPPASPPGKGIFAPPLSSSKTLEQPSSRSPERASAPANMYPISTSHPTAYDPAATSWQYEQDQPHRESYPPNRPIPIMNDAMHVDSAAGFEVTSRGQTSRRVSGGSLSSQMQVDSSFLSTSSSSSSNSHSMHERRASAMSDKSFDASEIYDAYAPGSPINLGLEGGEFPAGNNAADRPAGPVLGAVAPRGSSLKALSGTTTSVPPALGVAHERNPR
ncbi:hypothetical protein JCM10908_005894 [Rhodotorula pacifica]|uniref:uncharacterized protein n=1 Tax=Rhodotorula pacifica TaxID=1495444 RepID=UPI003176D405